MKVHQLISLLQNCNPQAELEFRSDPFAGDCHLDFYHVEDGSQRVVIHGDYLRKRVNRFVRKYNCHPHTAFEMLKSCGWCDITAGFKYEGKYG